VLCDSKGFVDDVVKMTKPRLCGSSYCVVCLFMASYSRLLEFFCIHHL